VTACAIAQALQIACEQRVETKADTWLPLPARTLCVHGDNPRALAVLQAVREALESNGFEIRA
jgi:5-oxoprolinase (ATP-hydrolysing) subunit A